MILTKKKTEWFKSITCTTSEENEENDSIFHPPDNNHFSLLDCCCCFAPFIWLLFFWHYTVFLPVLVNKHSS